jgi:phosphoglycerate dehydrogenase-like enzyme
MSRDVIVVHPRFDAKWPFAADDLARSWTGRIGPVDFIRLPRDHSEPLARSVPAPERIEHLVSLEIPVTPECVRTLGYLRVAMFNRKGTISADLDRELADRGVHLVRHADKSYWADSVAELGLGLTISALRRIPYWNSAVRQGGLGDWRYRPADGLGTPGQPGEQYADDSAFVNGTVAGKRVRIVGAGNIASRYAAMCSALGADVRAYDPYAPTPCFRLAGATRVHTLEELVHDAEIFAPMVPSTENTRGLVTARHLDALPSGGLVVLVTRADVCDMTALRRRVTRAELALAADVFDIEPLAVDDPLLRCPHAVVTPHIAGRTRDANRAWAEQVVDRFVAYRKVGTAT